MSEEPQTTALWLLKGLSTVIFNTTSWVAANYRVYSIT